MRKNTPAGGSSRIFSKALALGGGAHLADAVHLDQAGSTLTLHLDAVGVGAFQHPAGAGIAVFGGGVALQQIGCEQPGEIPAAAAGLSANQDAVGKLPGLQHGAQPGTGILTAQKAVDDHSFSKRTISCTKTMEPPTVTSSG